ncbi:hypothetical protein [Arenibacter latericius]|uniref:hypothetical protein n=1 Tax=Arenibacter latericius TaxID=86104 RepID=UPI000408CEC4|nr:hypothetical protein [Arenibacter latericius]MDX1363603.1 hypothetical protein [Arenibacter latericius]
MNRFYRFGQCSQGHISPLNLQVVHSRKLQQTLYAYPIVASQHVYFFRPTTEKELIV